MSGVHWDIRGLLKWWQDPWSSCRASSGDRLLLRCNRNARIPSPTNPGIRAFSRDEEGEQVLFLSCGGTLGISLDCRRGCWGIFELPQGFQGPFWGSGGNVEFFSRCHNVLRGESPVFTLVVVWFLSSYSGDLRDSLVGPQECPVSMRVARSLSGFLSSRCWGRVPYLELRPEPQCSSPVLSWTSTFLWSFHRGVRSLLVWRHASPLSSLAGKAVSGFLSG